VSPLPSSSPDGNARRGRPREVTLGGMQAVFGSVLALVVLVSAAQQLNGSEMTDALSDIVKSEQAATLGLTLEGARRLLRYAIMVMAVLSVASLVLGFYVLRRHGPSRVALTVIGAVVGVVSLAAGPLGWIATVYIGISIFLIWSRPARAWFAAGGGSGGSNGSSPVPGPPPGSGQPGPPPGSGQPGPPQGPRRDVDGVLPPGSDPEQEPHDVPPPPPPPPPRR
jgi:hypothetical protein